MTFGYFSLLRIDFSFLWFCRTRSDQGANKRVKSVSSVLGSSLEDERDFLPFYYYYYFFFFFFFFFDFLKCLFFTVITHGVITLSHFNVYILNFTFFTAKHHDLC